jgi:hypothetical protein
MLIEPNSFIRRIDHCLGRGAHWLDSRQCQRSEALAIILEASGVSFWRWPL